jgi:ATP-binding cassette subfamily F protein uup
MRLDTSNTVLRELGGDGGTIRFGNQEIPVRSWLRRFLFDDARMNELVEKLSGGERARLLLAKVLCRGGNVLVLDEPTYDLDLGSLRMLEEALAALGPRARVSDRLDDIVDQVALEARPNDVVLVMSNGGFGGIHSRLLDALSARAA